MFYCEQVESLFRAYHDKRTLKIEATKLRRSYRPSPSTSRVPSPDDKITPTESDAGYTNFLIIWKIKHLSTFP